MRLAGTAILGAGVLLVGVAGIYCFFTTDRHESAPLAIVDLRESSRQVPQFSKYEIDFALSRKFDNPYDPDQIDVSIQLTAPDGATLTHPGYFDECYRIELNHGKEVPRKSDRSSWRVRFTPSNPGRYVWRLLARTGKETAYRQGAFDCLPSDDPGFIQISATDPRYFEFSNGSFFYPIGHVCRSPVDWRWTRFSENGPILGRTYSDQGVFCYDDWFRRMADNGENFTSVWMCPWWCGLEWSQELPDYEGLGRYNQVNAARLDRIMELAERHGISLILYTSNHGMLSSVTDGEWHHNPLNKKYPGGYLKYASDFFLSEPALKAHRNRLRYTIARWGYSKAIAIWSISSETDWIEAYFGQRSLRSHERNQFQGFAAAPFRIERRQDLVKQWLVDVAEFIKSTDAHSHIVSTQFSSPKKGIEMWRYDAMEVVLNSAYTAVAQEQNWQGEYFVGSKGVADAIFVFGKRFEPFADRPALVAEWGGATDQNFIPHLKSELHVGIWVSFMTTNAGSTGFWWWNMVDKEDLYSHYRALSRFAEGEDRRLKRFKSARAKVFYEFPTQLESKPTVPLVIESPRELAVALYNNETLLAYVFNRETNQPGRSRPASGFNDVSFGESAGAYLQLPEPLKCGLYAAEFWDTFEGKVVDRKEFTLVESSRRLPLIAHNVDVAVKLRLIAPD